MRIRRMLLTIAAAVSALALPGALAQSAAAYNTNFDPILWATGKPSPGGSGYCLDDPGFNSSNGVQLDIWQCNEGSNQKFGLLESSVEPGVFLIRLGDNHSKCLADPWDSTQNGVKLEVYTCSDSPAFWWGAGRSTVGEYPTYSTFVNNYGMVFGNENGVAKNGNPVIMWQYFGGWNQTWIYWPFIEGV
jgi:hypothetical protein